MTTRRDLSQLRADYENRVAVGSRASPVVLVLTGALNPIHRAHIKALQTARSFLEREGKFVVVRGLLSPTHDGYVSGKLGKQALRGTVRLELVQLSAREAGVGDWLSADGWEVNHPDGFVDFPEVVRELQRQIDADGEIARLKHEGRPPLRVYYVCGSDHALRCGIAYSTLPTVCLSRPGSDYSRLQDTIARRKNTLLYS